jgi:hypothetical protein
MPRKLLNPSDIWHSRYFESRLTLPIEFINCVVGMMGRAIKGNHQAATAHRTFPDSPLLERTAAVFDLELMARHEVPAARRVVRDGTG